MPHAVLRETVFNAMGRCVVFKGLVWGAFLLAVSARGASGISNGQAAVDVLGQFDDSGNVSFTMALANQKPTDQGLSSPKSSALDAAGHRLFVADTDNNRVLVYDLDTSNNFVDKTADHVLGQANFTSNDATTTATGLYHPVRLTYDSAGQRLFVADYNNNRVVVYNVASITNGEAAVAVLGQSTLTTGGAAVTSTGLYSPVELTYDSAGQRLFVADSLNNRVVVYDVASITNGEAAEAVLGQSTFITRAEATTSTGLYGPSGLTYDSAGQKLFVADFWNNRVVVYNVASITNGEAAVSVLGQSNFTSAGNATTSTRLYSPVGLTYDSAGQKLFVADSLNNRVVVYNVASITNGEAAVAVLGQSTFITRANNTTATGLDGPAALTYDSGGQRLFVSDCGNHRVVVYNVTSITNGEAAVDELGQFDDSENVSFIKNVPNGKPTNQGFWNLRFSVLDTEGHRLFVSDIDNNRVLVFDLDNNNNFVDRTADHVLGQPDFTSNIAEGLTETKLYSPSGLAYDSVGQRLFVADSYNHRVVVYNVASITNGQAAVAVLGQSGFTTRVTATTETGMNSPVGVAYDSTGQRLFVSESVNHRVMVYNVTSITNGEAAVAVLGQNSFTNNPWATTSTGLNFPMGVAYDSGGQRLFVSDYGNHRVVVYNVASITNGEAAVAVLGQSGFTTRVIATTETGMKNPYGVAHDSAGQRLFVANYGNNRVMVYNVGRITNGQAAVAVLGQSDFTSDGNATTATGLYGPRGVIYDSANQRVLVMDSANHRVLLFNTPFTFTLSTPVVSVEATTTSITWRWDAVSGATYYRVLDSAVAMEADNGAGLSYTHGSLTPNQPLSLQVTAWSSTDASPPTTVQAYSLANPPTAVDLTMAVTSATLTWGVNENPPGTVFQVEHSTDGVSYTGVGTEDVYESSAVVTGLSPETLYQFRVKALNGDGVGTTPEQVSGTTGVSPPAPTVLNASIGTSTGTLILNWLSSGDNGTTGTLTGNYRVQYSTNPATVWSPTITPEGATTVTLSTAGVSPGTPQSVTLSVPTTDLHHVVLWTQDHGGNWSEVSNTVSCYPAFWSVSVFLGEGDLFDMLFMPFSGVSQRGILVTNTGTLAGTFRLRAEMVPAGDHPWTFAPVPVFNELSLRAMFHPTRPSENNFGEEDLVSEELKTATDTIYSSGVETATDVPAGDSRTLWFRLDTPPNAYESGTVNFRMDVTIGE